MLILLPYIVLPLFVYIMNLAPALMPATWIVLALFYIHFHMTIIPVVLLGATSATLGRITLAHISHEYFAKLLSKKTKENLQAVGKFLNKNAHLTIPIIILYAFLPIPSNQVFIAAGLSRVHIKILALSFFVGRLISYTFWVLFAATIVNKLMFELTHHYSNIGTFMVEIIGFSLLYVFAKIPWLKILPN